MLDHSRQSSMALAGGAMKGEDTTTITNLIRPDASGQGIWWLNSGFRRNGIIVVILQSNKEVNYE
jgi:hypothetical protein